MTDEFPMTVTGKVRKIEMREKSTGIPRPLAPLPGRGRPRSTLVRQLLPDEEHSLGGGPMFATKRVRIAAAALTVALLSGGVAAAVDLDRLGQPATEARRTRRRTIQAS